MISVKGVLLAIMVLLLSAGQVETATANTDAARHAAKAAEAAVARGDYRAADQALVSVSCQGNVDCRALLAFTQAWVYEAWSKLPSEQSAERRDRAVAFYQRANKDSPGNTQILTNLALAARRAGDSKTAIDAMWSVIKLDESQAYQGYLFLGDVWQSIGKDKRALHNYKLAVKANPRDGQGHQRLLDYYRKAGSVKDLFELSFKLRRELPNIAASGFAYTIGLAYQTDEHKAGESLAHWTTIQSDLGALSLSNLRQLPNQKDWNFVGLRQMRQIVKLNSGPPAANKLSWWIESSIRQDAMSRLLRLKAKRLIDTAEDADVSAGERADLQRTAISYLSTAVDTAPKYFVYLDGDLAGSSNARLDAATSLATLHHSLKAGSDPMGVSGISEGELNEMTQILFAGKGGAYTARRLADIQRFHTVLGLIYYETRQDTSAGADNATFQLQHALRTADEVARLNPEKYEPLPELRMLLAEVYQRQGKNKDSGEQALVAAMGYLEKDNLRAAGKALDSANRQGIRTAAVEFILHGREAVLSEGAALLIQQAGSNTVRLDPRIDWLKGTDNLGLPKKFIEQQRFKTLADLGNRLVKSGDKALARSVNDLAFQAAQLNRVLTSPSDIKRIQRLETNIKLSPIQMQVIQPVKIEGLTRVSPPVAEQPSWTLPSNQGDYQIQIDPKLLDRNRLQLDRE